MGDETQGGAGGALQFERAEFTTPAAQACAVCKVAITESYYAVGGAIICPACSDKLTGKNAGRGAFLRAWLWGGGAALLGSLVWFGIVKLANMELGIVAIAVGYAVGIAVRRASGGRGGWKYQALAMFLTYASIVSSYVPFVIQGIGEYAKKQHAAEHDKATGKAADGTSEPAARGAGDETAAKPKPKLGVGGFVLGLVFIFGIAFAAPFLGGTSSIMGLIIIAIALYEAWKLNRRIPVTGPFRVGGGLAPAGAPAGTP